MISSKGIAEKFVQKVWNEKDLTVLDTLIHPDIKIHSLLGNFYGANALKDVIHAWLKGFPDLKVTNNMTVTEDDKVVILWNAQGIHQGEFKGKAPKGKTVSYSGVTIYRIKDEKINEYWAYLDMNHLLNQLS